MSTTTTYLQPGDTLVLSSSDKDPIVFDWSGLPDDADISTYTFTIDPIRQVDPDADLTKDSEDFVSGQTRQLQVRLLATTASLGDIYWVRNTIVTNETPARQLKKSIRVLIQD